MTHQARLTDVLRTQFLNEKDGGKMNASGHVDENGAMALSPAFQNGVRKVGCEAVGFRQLYIKGSVGLKVRFVQRTNDINPLV